MTNETTIPFDSQPGASPVRLTRPMYWSIRRELWENRSIYLAPLAVAALVTFAMLISMIGMPRKAVSHFGMAPAAIMLTTFLVGVFFCLDALNGERRDRSILFWKSLPVSDRTTVLSKAAIPLVVLPLLGFLLGAAVMYLLLILSTAALLGSGTSPLSLWSEVRFVQQPFVMIYGMTVHTLWFAPIYAWLLLVSAWARRTPVLWAVLPPLAIVLFERIVSGSGYFGNMLRYRVTGAMTEAFTHTTRSGHVDRLAQLDPLRFLSAPGLWVGLMFAAACLAAAVRLRRNRQPV